MSANGRNLSERQFEILVGKLLRYGVIIATAIVFLGGVLYLINHGNEAPNYEIFRGEPPYLSSPEGVATAALSGRHRGIIQVGLIFLIITPVARVAFSLLAFMRQRDTMYSIVTIIVLLGLLLSLTGN